MITERDKDELIRKSKYWDTKEFQFICLDPYGNVYFSNDFDFNGTTYWTKSAFDRDILKRHLH